MGQDEQPDYRALVLAQRQEIAARESRGRAAGRAVEDMSPAELQAEFETNRTILAAAYDQRFDIGSPR